MRLTDVARVLNIAASLGGIILLAPILVLIGIVIKLSDGGPVVYRSRRVGKNGVPFELLKFRTMVNDADKQGPGITTRGDPRVTTVGRFLRRTKLDELPQLLNVLRGDMALVGPRPEDPRYVAEYSPAQREILQVRPGMTSAASLAYRDEESMLSGENWETIYRTEVLPAKIEIDLEYLGRRSTWSDLRIVLRTVVSVLR